MEEKKEDIAPPTNIKDYIIASRKQSVPDSKIIENLKTSGWPDDIIQSALPQVDSVIKAVPEPIKQPPEKPLAQNNQANNDIINNELFTQPPSDVFPQKKPEEKKTLPKKKGFAILSIFAFLLSPIPFIGLGFGMAALDYAKKKNTGGSFLAILAILINFGVIIFIAYTIYQIFTLSPTDLTGFSKAIVEKFNLLGG